MEKKINKNGLVSNAVTYEKLQKAAADNVVLGNISGADSNFAELSASQLAGIVDGELLIDEDDFASDSDTKAPTQQSTKAYVDGAVIAPDVVLLSTQTASSSASVAFTGLSSTYHTYEVRYSSCAPATDGAYLGIRTSTNGGSSYDSGASDYITQSHAAVGSTTAGQSFTGSYSRLSYAGVGSASNEQVNGSVMVMNPSASQHTYFLSKAGYINTLGDLTTSQATGYRSDTSAVDAVQILFSTGDIASGTFKLYGYK